MVFSFSLIKEKLVLCFILIWFDCFFCTCMIYYQRLRLQFFISLSCRNIDKSERKSLVSDCYEKKRESMKERDGYARFFLTKVSSWRIFHDENKINETDWNSLLYINSILSLVQHEKSRSGSYNVRCIHK